MQTRGLSLLPGREAEEAESVAIWAAGKQLAVSVYSSSRSLLIAKHKNTYFKKYGNASGELYLTSSALAVAQRTRIRRNLLLRGSSVQKTMLLVCLTAAVTLSDRGDSLVTCGPEREGGGRKTPYTSVLLNAKGKLVELKPHVN